MAVRKIVLILLALLIAGATVQFTRSVMSQNRAAPAPVEAAAPAPKATRILVAASDLPAGTLVQPAHLRWRVWPDDDGLERTYMVEGARTIEEFAGAVVHQGLRAGEPVAAGRLVKPDDRGFLAAVLTPGTRAVSVAINGVTGIGGFVFPGDRVDLILTQRIKGQDDGAGDGAPDRRASETVLSDVRVLAMDQRSNDQKGEAKLAQIATLEVTPRQAEAVALAAELGHVSLSLRSLGQPAGAVKDGAVTDGVEMAAAEALATTLTDASETPVSPIRSLTITWDSDLSRAMGVQARPETKPEPKSDINQNENSRPIVKVQVVRGRESAEVSFPQR